MKTSALLALALFAGPLLASAAVGEYCGWGYFDFRMKGEGFPAGYQSIPADWTISSPRKAGFFRLLAEIKCS
jgi:hypothetical protein